MDIRIEQWPAVRVAYVRGGGPFPETLPRSWGRLTQYAREHGLEGPGRLYVTICHDAPNTTPPEKLRSDAAISVDDDFVPDGDVQVQTMPAGTYAVARHQGPYVGLPQAWARFCGEALGQRGLRFRPAPMFEVYRNSPCAVPPDQLLTDLFVPVEAPAQ